MSTIDIEHLHSELLQRLSGATRDVLHVRVVGESGLQIKIDGTHCLTSIGVWPNGCCDVDYLHVSSEQGEFKHFEFENAETAIATVLQEIQLAVDRA